MGETVPACLEMLTFHWFYVLGWLPDVPEGLQQEHLPDILQIRDHSPTESMDVPYQGISPCRASSLFLEVFALQCCAAILPPEMLPVWGCHCDNFFVMQIGPLACLSCLSFLSFSHLAACYIYALETLAKKPFTPTNLIIPLNMEWILPGQPCRSAYE